MTRARSSGVDAAASSELALLGVAVAAISTSAPLVRGADAPTLAIAFWRNAIAVPVVLLAVVVWQRSAFTSLSRRNAMLSLAAGGCLALHFATWIPSLSFTTVASSVALVATQPVWAAVIARVRGEVVDRGSWLGISLALGGTALLGGVDWAASGRALFGDLLALVGGILAAVYVTIGAEVRREVPTSVYVAICYSAASFVLVLICLLGSQPLTGYDGDTWWAIVAMVAGPQLLGHTVMNRTLRVVSPTVVSVAILLEVVGAALLARLFFDETVRATAWPAAALILAGVVVVVRSSRSAPSAAFQAQ